MKKVAVFLSGCGAKDGAEIREAVCLLLSLSQLGIKYEYFSLDKPQAFVYNHLTEKVALNETRNVLEESARIARGKVQDASLFNADNFDGVAFVGGYGAGVNFSNFAIKNSIDFTIEPLIERVIQSTKKAGKPMYFLCISPILAIKALGNIKVTLGSKSDITEALKQTNAEVVEVSTNTPIFDEANKIITTPCYMLNITLAELYDGIYKGAEKFASIL